VTVPEAARLDAALLQGWPLPLDEHGDKFDRGTTLVIGGSAATPGAVMLAGISALRMGAGRLQIATDPSVANDVAVAMPEAMVMPLQLDADLSERVGAAQSVLVGPGLSSGDDRTRRLLELVLRNAGADTTVVVDAAALADLPAAVGHRGHATRVIMTPNRQEAVGLLTALTDTAWPAIGDPDADRLDAVLERIATNLPGVVTSFGLVCAPDGRRWRAQDGGPGLSTSGSGDVLAGLAAGAAARTSDAAQAACWATFVHAATARHLTAHTGGIGFLARELADAIGPATAQALRTTPHPG
jgi:ADP-dependent NAD(P)H-hydrate dehydratase